jgi:hypothetical protein
LRLGVFALIESVFIRGHPWLKPQFLKPVVHFLEMEIEREKPFEFVLHRG